MKKMLIVDGASLAYRSYFAFQQNPLVNSKGIKTSAPYAFTNSLIKLLRELNPTHAAVVFDAKGKTFRHEMYVEYKAQRPKAPPDFAIQLSYIKEIIDGFNIKRLEIPGVEADDVIATLSKECERKGFQVFIATLDKDLYQLVTENIKIVDTREGSIKIVGVEDVEKKFGVKPHLIPDLLALIGDKIDNIPNVPGIGEKTGVELLNLYGSVENILYADEKNSEIVRRVKEYREQVLNTLLLVRLKDDLDLKVDLEDFALRDYDRERLFRIFGELEFYSLMANFAIKPQIEVVRLSYIPLDFLNADTVSFELGRDGKMYLAKESKVVYEVPIDCGIEFLKKFKGKKVTFESKAFYRALGRYDIGVDFDILVSTFLVNSDRPRFDAESIVLEYTGWNLNAILGDREAGLCSASYMASQILDKELKIKGVDVLLGEVELPFQKVLAHMERTGIKMDIEKLKELEKSIQGDLNRLEQKIYELAGKKFNINSPKQLAEILFTHLKLKPVKKTKTGYSTDEESLRKLAEVHPLPQAILEYRELFKIKSTYIDSFKDLIDPRTGRIHPTYNQVGAATGRISCKNPNFQTLPIKSELGKKVRDALVAEDGYLILSADYSQVELRILAHLSGDEKLIEIFEKDLDVHSMTASYIFAKPVEEISESERRKAKTVNFGIVYGISPYGLSKELGIDVSEAEKLISRFFATFPKVSEWIRNTLDFAVKNGFVRTLFGRYRSVSGIYSDDPNIREQSKRIAINTPIQGTAADIMKIAMVKIFDKFSTMGLSSRIILQIHDEILVEVKEEEREVVTEIVRDSMEQACKLRVPLKVDLSIGKSWLLASD